MCCGLSEDVLYESGDEAKGSDLNKHSKTKHINFDKSFSYEDSV